MEAAGLSNVDVAEDDSLDQNEENPTPPRIA